LYNIPSANFYYRSKMRHLFGALIRRRRMCKNISRKDAETQRKSKKIFAVPCTVTLFL